MKKHFKSLITTVLCMSLLFGAALPCYAVDDQIPPTKTITYTTSGGNTIKYTMTECTPNTPVENSFSPTGGVLHQWGTEWFYFTDGYASRTYTFKGEKGQLAYVVMDLSQEFLVSVSTDNGSWTDCLNSNNDGRFREMRAIDLSPWFVDSNTVYVKISDSIPTTGWGGQIRALRYVTVTGTSGISAYYDISEGWETSLSTTVDAGHSVEAEISFKKTVSVPEAWIGGDLAVSFSWIESGRTPIVLVDGREVQSVTAFGNNLTIPLPPASNGKDVELEVVTTATSDGKCGLWNSVRIGYLDMITMPESKWTLDGETKKIHENYYTEGNADFVRLNALAGNFASSLLNTDYNLLGFNTMIREEISNSQLYYSHDTSRTLVGLAFEEMYSPIVRLDTIESLYNGIKSAMVPGSDYELFLKRDARPRNAVAANEGGVPVMRMQTHQDVSGQFADVYTAPLGQEATGLTVSDRSRENGIDRLYTAGGKSISMDVEWHKGDTDKPTTLSFSSDGTSKYRVVYNNFQIPFRGSLSKYTTITTKTQQLVNPTKLKDIEIAPPLEGYLVLSSQLTWTEHPTIITWDIAPETILIKTDEQETYISEIEFIYGAEDKPTMTTLYFDGVDVGLKWPYQVASNIVNRGIFGANGFDPTYVCGVEGLGTGALAAAAYIFHKYDHPLASEAEELAVNASLSAYEASVDVNHTPSFYLDRVQAAYFLSLLGYDEFLSIADYYGQYVLREQAANGDGTTNWFDARMPLTMQVVYEATGMQEYHEAFELYLTTITYYDDHLEYKNTNYYSGSFSGAGEMGYLGHKGDAETLAKVMKLSPESYDDTGVSGSSDLNPYFLGWSLKGMMNVQYKLTDKKTVVQKGEYALYDADGNVQIMNFPTAYINNPYLSNQIKQGDVDGDDSISASDALLALQHSVSKIVLSDKAFKAADVDKDNKVSSSDALKILQYSVGSIDNF